MNFFFGYGDQILHSILHYVDENTMCLKKKQCSRISQSWSVFKHPDPRKELLLYLSQIFKQTR